VQQGISSKAFGRVGNKKKYNGIELGKALDLNVYDAQFRELDPQVGRWWQIDPKTDEMYRWSTYASNFDNPIRFEDHLGMCRMDAVKGLLQ
jgi:RHS repeat-associated protein